jgi:uncharacterized membrane protein YecN with MAPEG domain
MLVSMIRMEDMDSGNLWAFWLVGVVALALVVVFFWRLANIDNQTRRAAVALEAISHTLHSIQQKAVEVQREGLRVQETQSIDR